MVVCFTHGLFRIASLSSRKFAHSFPRSSFRRFWAVPRALRSERLSVRDQEGAKEQLRKCSNRRIGGFRGEQSSETRHLEVPDCCPKVKKDMVNMDRELANLKGQIRAKRPKAAPLAQMRLFHLPPKPAEQFPPSPKKRRIQMEEGDE
jgi:hypothetical protein